MPGFDWNTGALADPQPPEIPGFHIVSELGRGGMGVVYRAVDAGGREVALKVLPPHQLTPLARARFAREAELLARVEHPGVLRIHAWGQHEGTTFFATELVEGARHVDVAARELDLLGRLELIRQLAEAIAAAHAAGIVHRDLKPGNVLVDAHGRVKVIDFGVSRGAGVESLTQSNQFVGTPLYAPAERFLPGRDDDPRGDVWALGAVAYELLTGVSPYPARTLVELHARARRLARPPHELVPELDTRTSDQIVRALHPEPAQRHPDAGAFARALANGRRAGRARALVGIGGAVLAAALVALVGVGRGAAARPQAEAPSDTPVASARVEPGGDPVELGPAREALARKDYLLALELAADVEGREALEIEAVARAWLGEWEQVAQQLEGVVDAGELGLLRARARLLVLRPGADAELPKDDPVRRAELARRAWALLNLDPEAELNALLQNVLPPAEACPLADPAGDEVRRRVQAAAAGALTAAVEAHVPVARLQRVAGKAQALHYAGAERIADATAVGDVEQERLALFEELERGLQQARPNLPQLLRRVEQELIPRLGSARESFRASVHRLVCVMLEAYARAELPSQQGPQLRRLADDVRALQAGDAIQLDLLMELAIYSKRYAGTPQAALHAYASRAPSDSSTALSPWAQRATLELRFAAGVLALGQDDPELTAAVGRLESEPAEDDFDRHRRRLVRRARGVLWFEQGVASFQAGRAAEGRAALRKARELLRRINAGLLVSQIALAEGDLDGARAAQGELRGWRAALAALEIALAAGEPDAIRAGLASLRAEPKGPASLRDVTGLHAELVLGLRTREDVIERLGALATAYEPRRVAWSARIPWHTPLGLLRIVRDGLWWPGSR